MVIPNCNSMPGSRWCYPYGNDRICSMRLITLCTTILLAVFAASAASFQTPVCQKRLVQQQLVRYCTSPGIYNCQEDPNGDECCAHLHDTLEWHDIEDGPIYTGKKQGTSTVKWFRSKDQYCDGLDCKDHWVWRDCDTHFRTDYTLADCPPK